MGLTHAEFFRIIPGVFTDCVPVIEGRTIRARWPGRQLMVTLGPEQRRRIALLALPRTEVMLEFRGFSEQQIGEFLAHFDRRFQRGGG
ncbi:MAG: hypothetical protein LAT50_17505 [Ectothiorhodospiraceae bacterium]|nr:hypothetical protein [Ectothiorhodospiraceae bacterium]